MPYIVKENVWTHATDENIAKFLERHLLLGKKKSVLIVDDQTAEAAINRGAKGLWAKLNYDSRWLNLSIVVITHRVTGVSTAMRENLEHLILLDLGTRKQVKVVEEEFNFLPTKAEFLKLYQEEITNVPFGTIHINLIPPICIFKQCSDKPNAILLCAKVGRDAIRNSHRGRKRIFPDEHTETSTKRLRL